MAVAKNRIHLCSRSGHGFLVFRFEFRDGFQVVRSLTLCFQGPYTWGPRPLKDPIGNESLGMRGAFGAVGGGSGSVDLQRRRW